MKLIRAEIVDFGIWHNKRIELAAPVTLIYGPNESGKSTFMAFIRFMLFGYPPRLKLEHKHESRRSPTIGGTLIVADDEGVQYRLERFEQIGMTASSRASTGIVRFLRKQVKSCPSQC